MVWRHPAAVCYLVGACSVIGALSVVTCTRDKSDPTCLTGWAAVYPDPNNPGAVLPVDGGEGAPQTNIYTVTTHAQMKNALMNINSPTYATNPNAAKLEKKIIFVSGTIYGDMLDDGNFANETYYKMKSVPKWDHDWYLLSLNTTFMSQLGAAVTSLGDSTTTPYNAIYATLKKQNGWRMQFANSQKAVVEFTIPSNTSVIGIGSDARILGGYLVVNAQTNIIIRNLYIEPVRDLAPSWDFKEWNARYKGISIVTGTRIWIDHCVFDDGRYYDKDEPLRYGSQILRHDGLLDMEDGADYVTVSHCIFSNHHKTSMLGSGDGHADKDSGKLRITFYGNLYNNSQSRNPMVRFGKVHSLANYFTGFASNASTSYPMKGGYYIGARIESAVLSESNYFEYRTENPKSSDLSIVLQLAMTWRFKDEGSCFNGVASSGDINTLAQSQFEKLKAAAVASGTPKYYYQNNFTTDLGWLPTYSYAKPGDCLEAQQSVLANSGVGKINVGTPCLYAPSLCDDGKICTKDTCDAAIGCVHTSISCDDGNAATADTCTESSGCTCAPACAFSFSYPEVPAFDITRVSGDQQLNVANPIRLSSGKDAQGCNGNTAEYLWDDGVTWNSTFVDANGAVQSISNFYASGTDVKIRTIQESQKPLLNVLTGRLVRLSVTCNNNVNSCLMFSIAPATEQTTICPVPIVPPGDSKV